MELKDRIKFVNDAVLDGYLLAHYIYDTGRIYVTTYKDTSIGFYLDELLEEN